MADLYRSQDVFNPNKFHLSTTINGNGHIKSVRALIIHENVINSHSDEHTSVYS